VIAQIRLFRCGFVFVFGGKKKKKKKGFEEKDDDVQKREREKEETGTMGEGGKKMEALW
jgi:hypothetical protein